MQTTPLKTIQIAGPDAETFLQGQCTCDVPTLSEKPLFSACCNHKGRMLANFWIWRDADVFFLQLPNTMAILLRDHLQKYIVFSKATIEMLDNTITIKKPNDTPIWVVPETSEQFIPQMMDMEKNGGVSFTKGCYIGQEIVARTEHLGTLKRHLYQLTVHSDDIKVGNTISNAENQILGVVVAVFNNAKKFAVIEDRGVNEALQCNDCDITEIKRNTTI